MLLSTVDSFNYSVRISFFLFLEIILGTGSSMWRVRVEKFWNKYLCSKLPIWRFCWCIDDETVRTVACSI